MPAAADAVLGDCRSRSGRGRHLVRFRLVASGRGRSWRATAHVYAQLQARHGRVLLIGADAPQLTPSLLQAAVDALRDDGAPFVMGEASDGGFWLFGGRLPIPREVWTSVRYSQPRTAAELCERLTPHGGVAGVPALTDVDSAADLPVLREALAALVEPLPAQRFLHDWLRLTLVRAEPSAAGG